MKYILNLFIENNDKSFLFLRFLRANGYNGTVFSTASLKHTLEDITDDDKIFINLQHLDPKSLVETTYCFFIVEEDKLEELKQLIREKTNQFTTIKGGMYSYALHDFEGSF